MKRLLCALLTALLLFLLCGCAPSQLPGEWADPTVRTQTDYTDMEIYQSLRGGVTEESSLEEMLEAFSRMCAIEVDSSTNMFLYEVYSYESDGEVFINCHIVRQVDEPGTDEYIQLHMDIVFAWGPDMEDFQECIWFSNDAEGFLSYIRSSKIYESLKEKPIYRRYVSIDSTW